MTPNELSKVQNVLEKEGYITKAQTVNPNKAYKNKLKYVNISLFEDTLPDILGFYQKLPQPTEQKVKQAMLLTITDHNNELKLSYKAGGGALSDNLFSSSLSVKNGTEWEVIIKKYSTNFQDVIISENEIYHLEKIINTYSRSEIPSNLAYEFGLRYKTIKPKNVKEFIIEHMFPLIENYNITKEEITKAINFAIEHNYNKEHIEGLKTLFDMRG